VEEPQIDFRPKGVSDAQWESIPEGARIRFVRNHQYELDLTPQQYDALYRLPYWLLYGPEHGAPASWFNPRGFLLPKYQPGGGQFPEFRDWRRRYRSRRWLNYRINERIRRLRERYKGVYAVAGLVGFVGLYALSWWIANSRFEEGPALWATYGILLVLYVAVVLLAVKVQLGFVRRRVERRWREREGR